MANVILTGYVILPKTDFDAISRALPEHIRLTLEEPGCVDFRITQDKDDPFKFSLYEEFINQAAFDHHQKRTHASAWHEIAKNMQRHFSILVE